MIYYFAIYDILLHNRHAFESKETCFGLFGDMLWDLRRRALALPKNGFGGIGRRK